MATIAAISTAPGAGGIAVIRMSGQFSKQIALQCVGKRTIKARRAIFCNFIDPNTKEIVDEIVLTYFLGPKSYTGEDVVEIACHGSLYIQKRILQICIEQGCRLANPGEFTQRAFLNGRMDLTQAEGVADLIASETAAAHQLAIKQMKGNISDEMKNVRSSLIKFAALIELENDFGEEDVEFANRQELTQRIVVLKQKFEQLITSFKQGRALKEGVSVVIAGKPNAGKSTLLNALAKEERAIVSDIAGTTRDVVDARIDIKGVRFRFIDTAGLRESTDVIEQIGVSKAKEQIANAEIIIYLYDVNDLSKEAVEKAIGALQLTNQQLLIVANKADLAKGIDVPGSHYLISAKEQTGQELLLEAIFEAGVGKLPTSQSVIITHTRHVSHLKEALEGLNRVEEGIELQQPSDILALDLRQVITSIGEITGEISADDLLDSIFRDFCIGK